MTHPVKLLVVVGTRPEAIKLAPVIRAARDRSAEFNCRLVVTAQHRSMLDQVLEIFGIEPDYDLDVMAPNQSLSGLTSRLVEKIAAIVTEERPDWLIVQGDTTSAMAGALVAFYEQVKIAHVEAGLRTGNLSHPFPEEFNRRVIDLVAGCCFAPTQLAADNLLGEGISPERVIVSGNTVVDALDQIGSVPFSWEKSPLMAVSQEVEIVLVTAHRRESFGEKFREISLAIVDIANRFPLIEIVFPLHLNPNIQEPARAIFEDVSNVRLLDPLDYLSFVQLMKVARLILTDSGGIQEEAPSFQVPVLIMRDTTERPEAIDAGFATLVGSDRNRIRETASAILARPAEESRKAGRNPFGDGHASKRILDHLSSLQGEENTN